MTRQVLLKINQDWNSIEKAYDNVYQKCISGSIKPMHFEEHPGIEQYNLGVYGSFIKSLALCDNWHAWNGKLLYSLLPWYDHSVKLFDGLNFVSVSYYIAYGPVEKHRDGSKNTERGIPRTNLNYIIYSEDVNAVTNCYHNDDSLEFTYPAKPDTAWLIDPKLPHEIINKGKRVVFQFKFDNSYEEVSNHLSKIEPISLG